MRARHDPFAPFQCSPRVGRARPPLGLSTNSQNLPSHVILPRELAKSIPKNRLLEEHEWRGLGVQQSRGWAHYAVHRRVQVFGISTLNPPFSNVIDRPLPPSPRPQCTHIHGNRDPSCPLLARFRPEPHILLFRRLLGTNPTTGKVEQALKKEALSKYEKEYGSSAA